MYGLNASAKSSLDDDLLMSASDSDAPAAAGGGGAPDDDDSSDLDSDDLKETDQERRLRMAREMITSLVRISFCVCVV